MISHLPGRSMDESPVALLAVIFSPCHCHLVLQPKAIPGVIFHCHKQLEAIRITMQRYSCANDWCNHVELCIPRGPSSSIAEFSWQLGQRPVWGF